MSHWATSSLSAAPRNRIVVFWPKLTATENGVQPRLNAAGPALSATGPQSSSLTHIKCNEEIHSLQPVVTSAQVKRLHLPLDGQWIEFSQIGVLVEDEMHAKLVVVEIVEHNEGRF